MKFEELEFTKKIAFLRRLHAELNNILFDGKLKEDLKIDICSISGYYDSDVWACFATNGYEIITSPTGTGILFDHRFVEDASKIYDSYGADAQLRFICCTMLHEMVHQYIYETGRTEDKTHKDIYMEESLKHGLRYENEGEPEPQYIDLMVMVDLLNTGVFDDFDLLA